MLGHRSTGPWQEGPCRVQGRGTQHGANQCINLTPCPSAPVVHERFGGRHGSGYAGVGAANRDVANSQQMIEELPCHMRGDMPARNAGNTRRFEGVANEDPCHMRCDMTARNAGKLCDYEGVAIEDRDAAFKVFPAYPACHGHRSTGPRQERPCHVQNRSAKQGANQCLNLTPCPSALGGCTQGF